MNFCVYLQLEYLSIAGFLFVLMLLFTMVVESCKAGLPAIGNGEFSVVGFTDICEPPPVPPPVIFSISSLNTITQYHYSIPLFSAGSDCAVLGIGKLRKENRLISSAGWVSPALHDYTSILQETQVPQMF